MNDEQAEQENIEDMKDGSFPMTLAKGPEQAIMRAANALTLTPAQARVESVARTMDAAMNRASTLILTPEEITALKAEFPDDAFKPGAAGKEHLIYIEHAFLRDRFDQVLGMGQWACLRTRPHWAEEFETAKREKAVRIYADCALLVRGCMVSESIGEMVYYPNNTAQNYGDAAEGAVTAAFRRCAKNFGVGLQAWKKDYGDGWWARRRGGPPPVRPAPAAPVPEVSAAGWSYSAPPGRTFKSAAERTAALDLHLEKCKLKLVSDLEKEGEAAVEFMQKAGHLMPNETKITEANVLTLFRSVPNQPDMNANESDGDWWARVQEAIAPDAKKLQREFDAFARGDQIKGAEVPEDIHVPRDADAGHPAPAASSASAEPWYSVIVPVPRRGMTRDDYLKNPDTIGSLYERRHGTDEDSQLARQRLWGFVNNYEPKGWTTRDGREMPASKTDIQFRDALNLFAEWFSKTHPDEKL